MDELYTLAPEDFTAARNALVKHLRAEGRRADADAVKALRRPTVAAWAVNQTVRRHRDAVEELIAAGSELSAAQRRALSGVKGAGLREAAGARRERLDAVWRLAAAVLSDAGVDAGVHRQAVTDTFEAASADPDAAEQVRAARLSRELPAPAGFGAVSGFALVSEPAEQPPDSSAGEPVPDEEAAKTAQRRQALVAARAEAQRTERRATELADRAGDARQAAMRATAEAERLEGLARQARARAADAQEEAEQRRQQADEAAAAAAQAAQALRALSDD